MSDNIDYQRIAVFFPLISAWGTAVENGKDAQQEFSALAHEYEKDPAQFMTAIDLAYAWQQTMRKQSCDVGENDPSHPNQRMDRLVVLKDKLEKLVPCQI